MKIKVETFEGPGYNPSRPFESRQNAELLLKIMERWRAAKLSQLVWRGHNLGIGLATFKAKILGGRDYMDKFMLAEVDHELARLAHCISFKISHKENKLTITYVNRQVADDPLAAMEIVQNNTVEDISKRVDNWIDSNPPLHAVFEEHYDPLDDNDLTKLQDHINRYLDNPHYIGVATETLIRIIRKGGYDQDLGEATIEAPELPPSVE